MAIPQRNQQQLDMPYPAISPGTCGRPTCSRTVCIAFALVVILSISACKAQSTPVTPTAVPTLSTQTSVATPTASPGPELPPPTHPSGPPPPSQPSFNIDTPLPESPPDAPVSVTLGPVTISTYNPVTITPLEYSTNLYFVARNDGDQAVTIRFTSLPEIVQSQPPWIYHFFSFQPEATILEPGTETTFEFLVTNEGDGEVELPFRFALEETGDAVTIPLELVSRSRSGELPPITAAVTGRVTDVEGQPLANVEVSFHSYNGGEDWRGVTDEQGHYHINLPSMEDIQAAFGARSLPYESLTYFALVDAEGYVLAYKDGIAPLRGETLTFDLTLEPAPPALRYREMGELSTDGAYGYWWLLPDDTFTRLFSVQAKHPPMLDVPGHFLMADLSGTERWRVPTGNECWGFDVTSDGERVAAGCHNGVVYLADDDGNLLWQLDCGAMNREVEFSPDGAYLFTGPYAGEDTALLDAATGAVMWTYNGPREWLRNSRWSPDGERIIAGFGGGQLVMLTEQGEALWIAYIGEFPMTLEIDDEYNVYAAGKNRELFSFDANGNLRWRHRIPDHVVSSGSQNLSAEGDLIVFGTVAGWVYAFTSDGEIAWRQRLPASRDAVSLGHNALAITPDGMWIVAGAAGGDVVLYDRAGTLRWSYHADDRRDPQEYDHTNTGVICVAVSDDATRIAAGYGDSTIRVFELE